MDAWVSEEASNDRIDRAAQAQQRFNEYALWSLMERRRRQSAHARERAAQGLAAVCETCGGPIPPLRRKALPDATRCIQCQIDYEKRQN